METATLSITTKINGKTSKQITHLFVQQILHSSVRKFDIVQGIETDKVTKFIKRVNA